MTTLGSKERAHLARIADVLVPRAEGMPSATEAGAVGVWLDRVLEARPDLGQALVEILRHVEGESAERVVPRLEVDDSEALAAILVAVAGAYYMSPEVRRRLGYPGQEAFTLDVYADLSAYIDEGLLEPVLERGPRYRPAKHDVLDTKT